VVKRPTGSAETVVNKHGCQRHCTWYSRMILNLLSSAVITANERLHSLMATQTCRHNMMSSPTVHIGLRDEQGPEDSPLFTSAVA